MSERRLDPHALAERLDTLIPPGQFDAPPTSDDPLLNVASRLAGLPQPEAITPDARMDIRTRMLDAYQQQIVDAPTSTPRIPVRALIAGGIVIVIVVILILIVTRNTQEAVLPTRVPTETITPVPETATPLQAIVITPTPTTTVTAIESATPTATATIVTQIPATSTPLAAESTPEVTPSVDDGLPTTITIEGPVTAINANTITVFGINITIAPDNPILAGLQIGDVVRIEGEISGTGDMTIIVAVNITLLTDPVIIDQPGSAPPGLPAGCRITGRGGIRCDDSGRGRSSRGS